MEVSWGFSGEEHGLSDFVTEIVVIHGSEGIESLRELVGDSNLVENNVIFNVRHVLFWALNNFDNVVEVGPVH